MKSVRLMYNNTIIENGYTPDKIVFGILGDDYDSSSFIPIKEEINKNKNKISYYGRMYTMGIW